MLTSIRRILRRFNVFNRHFSLASSQTSNDYHIADASCRGETHPRIRRGLLQLHVLQVGMCNTVPRFSAYIKADAPRDSRYLRIGRRLRTKGRLRDRSQTVRPRKRSWRDEDGGWLSSRRNREREKHIFEILQDLPDDEIAPL